MAAIALAFAAGVLAPTAVAIVYRTSASVLASQGKSGLPYVSFEESFPLTFTREQGLEALGFDRAPTSDKEVIQRYRELIKDLHSDTGGTPYIARKLNEAKDACITPRRS